MEEDRVLGEQPRKARGLWRYLINHTNARRDTTKDAERNRLNLRYLQELPPGVDLTDSDTDTGGRTFSLTWSRGIVVLPVPETELTASQLPETGKWESGVSEPRRSNF